MEETNVTQQPQYNPLNSKLFKAQLQTLLTHHGVGKSCRTPDGVLADFLDHCLQSFIRAAQDRALMEAMTAAPTTTLDPEQAWLNDLLNQNGWDSDSAPPEPAPKVGPTVVKNGAPKVYKLPAVADQATIDLLSIEVAAAPSPVMVQFLLDGEIQKEWELNQTLDIGDLKYRVIAVQPDGTLLLNRIKTSSAAPEGTV
jgi:hypothetical protein